MLPHCTPWPEAFAERYRRQGYWTGETFTRLLQERTARHPDKLALVGESGRWSWRDFAQQTERCARGFHALGIRPKDRVVVQLPNCIEFMAVLFGLFRLGALPIFALPPHRLFEIGHFCKHAQAVAYVVADQHGGFDYRKLAREVQAVAPGLQHVIVLGEPQEFTALDALPDLAGELPAAPQPQDVAFLQLSGGSTGTPKLIPRTHDDYLYSVRASAEICQLGPQSIYMSVIPAGHNFTMSSPGSLGALYAGGCVVMCPHPSPDVALGWLAGERVTITALVPPLVPVWLDAIASSRSDLSSLQVLQVGGACFSSVMAERAVRELPHVKLQQVFGMAEGLVNYTRLDDPSDVVLRTQGRPISPDDEVRIVDEEDQPVPEGEVGQLLTRGPYTIRGYYKADEHNSRAFTTDGFYRTGDLVRRTPEGNLVVEGRAKDQINRGGEKVSAEEVEHQLRAHEAVHDCAVVAMPDAHLGEKSCAFVIRRDERVRGVDLVRFLRERGLATYKIPDRIEFVEHFPKTPVGKVSKKQLRLDIETRLAQAAPL